MAGHAKSIQTLKRLRRIARTAHVRVVFVSCSWYHIVQYSTRCRRYTGRHDETVVCHVKEVTSFEGRWRDDHTTAVRVAASVGVAGAVYSVMHSFISSGSGSGVGVTAADVSVAAISAAASEDFFTTL